MIKVTEPFGIELRNLGLSGLDYFLGTPKGSQIEHLVIALGTEEAPGDSTAGPTQAMQQDNSLFVGQVPGCGSKKAVQRQVHRSWQTP